MMIKKVNKKLNNYNEIKSSLIELFPKNELYPFWLLRILALRPNASFLAYYDDFNYVGFSFTYKYKDLLFILYLGVNNKVQNKGYGSQILNLLKASYHNSCIILNVESHDDKALNYNQRENRFKFYKKNDFLETNYLLKDDINYAILATKDFDIKKYKHLLRKFSFYMNHPKFIKK